MLNQLDTHTKIIFTGNILMVTCCLFYLFWWSIAFKPDVPTPTVKTVILFGLTVMSGLSGLHMIITGINAIPQNKKLIPTMVILTTGVLSYFVLLFLTSYFLHRQITTELLLIIGWGILEFYEINTLYGAGRFNHLESIVFLLIIVIVIVISMVCYIAYYQLEPMWGYYDGMIPLIVIGLVMAGIAVRMII